MLRASGQAAMQDANLYAAGGDQLTKEGRRGKTDDECDFLERFPNNYQQCNVMQVEHRIGQASKAKLVEMSYI